MICWQAFSLAASLAIPLITTAVHNSKSLWAHAGSGLPVFNHSRTLPHRQTGQRHLKLSSDTGLPSGLNQAGPRLYVICSPLRTGRMRAHLSRPWLYMTVAFGSHEWLNKLPMVVNPTAMATGPVFHSHER
uniref:(northern house mosquito) hypothetical protein n=1 Tax=Culex pipiens TaxID=7175 RepID=A0A8D8HC83_CULPI